MNAVHLLIVINTEYGLYMKVIDILNEGAAAETSERVLKSILGHSTWSAAQKIAFKDSVDLCADAIEKMLLKGQDTTTAAATKEAWFAIQPRLQGTPWATRDFVQEVFTVAKAEAEDRVAKKAGALKPAEAPAPSPRNAEQDREDKIRTGAGALQGWRGVAQQQTSFYVKWFGLGGYIAFDVVYNSYAEYSKNQEWALSQVKAGKMTAEQAKSYDASQKMQLILNVGATLAPLTLIVLKTLVMGPLRFIGWVRKVTSPKTNEIKEIPIKDLLSQANWTTGKSVGWASTLALLNSDQTLPSQNWSIYDSNGVEIGKVGRALTFRECLAYFAVNYSFGKDIVADAADDLNAWWNANMPDAVNYTTQKQDIEKAAGKPVTPNVVAKPPEVVDGIRIHNR
jgi:hypothetical protein